MEINTKRLCIIPCTLESYHVYSGKYKMGPHIDMHLEELKKDDQMKNWGVWFVIRRDNQQVIGDVGFKGKPDDYNTVEVGYGMIPEAQNKGFATEAVKAITDWAFSSGQVEKVIAECSIDNQPSISS